MMEEQDVFTDSEDEKSVQLQPQQRLIQAIQTRSHAVLNDLLHVHGISPNFIYCGKVPVCLATILGFEDILDILMEAGCDINVPDVADKVYHRQPIHICASQGTVSFMSRLLHYGADVNSRDDRQRTPLHCCAGHGEMDMAKLLISKGALVNLAEVDGFTPLHIAACLGQNNVCTVLLENGAEVNRTERDGWSALHMAACYGHTDVVKNLLCAGAAMSLVTNEEESAFHVAASHGSLECAKILVQNGAKIDPRNLRGQTPFYRTVYNSDYEMAKYLIKVGADITIPNNRGQTPFHLAALRAQEHFPLRYPLIDAFVKSGYNFSREQWLLHRNFPVGLEYHQPQLCDLLHHLATNPWKLQDLCVFRIRQTLGHNVDTAVNTLPLPACLKVMTSYSHW